MRPPRLTLPLALPPACPQRVSYARTTSNKVVMLKGGLKVHEAEDRLDAAEGSVHAALSPPSPPQA